MAFPTILLAIALVSALGFGARNEVIAIALVYIPRTARIVRASTLQLKARAFVEAAVALGDGDARILSVHIFQKALPPLIVQSTFVLAEAILADAALSSLGWGVKPPNRRGGTCWMRRTSFRRWPRGLLCFPASPSWSPCFR